MSPRSLALSALALAACLLPARALAQVEARSLALRFDAGLDAPAIVDRAPLHGTERYILIRLSENRLYLMDGRQAVWTAPVATGTGFTLEGAGKSWHFQTPRGVFRVQYKEKDPVWVKPDWAYVKEGKPIPPLSSPDRRQAGMLGTSALYIGYELAMHGTDRPELVLQSDPEERRVSHGCIRLTNEDARMLFHLVDVGTRVVIF